MNVVKMFVNVYKALLFRLSLKHVQSE